MQNFKTDLFSQLRRSPDSYSQTSLDFSYVKPKIIIRQLILFNNFGHKNVDLNIDITQESISLLKLFILQHFYELGHLHH